MTYFDPSRLSRGGRLETDSLHFVPRETKIHPLRDTLVVEPLEIIYSRYILVDHKTKPLRGVVRAVGPGAYQKQYDHADKHKRTKMWESKHFTPCEVKVGDVVELGGAEIQGYAFEQFWWGETLCLFCSERDVAGVIDGTTS